MVTTTLQLSEQQARRLSEHGKARNLSSPEEALQALLDLPLPQRRAWTELELSYLRNRTNTPRAIAQLTGRSVTAVSVRRNQLAREENRPDLQRPVRSRPPEPLPTPAPA